MSHWHEQTCALPRVNVKDGTPRCRACGRTVKAAELTTCDMAVCSVSAIPPNEARGMMNLRWPHSVPYKLPLDTIEDRSEYSDDENRNDTTLPHRPQFQRKTSRKHTSGAGIGPNIPSFVYPTMIRSEQFRLIRFTAADSYDSLVHLDLEVYGFDNCPEYEAVSYTWAGEDGDSTLKYSVYVGPYWDILWQTKNCWEMLRFVRPSRGVRMLWVDAICINQSDVIERNGQVANMARIYSECVRSVVYLGPDIAIPLDGNYPRRRRLHELEVGLTVPKMPADSIVPRPMLRLRAILGRKYFSRVWVVQELLLSQNTVIRIGDVDFWVDPIGATYLSLRVSNWKWESTSAPWIQHLTQGAPGLKDLSELLLLTSKSHSTDPRDRVFGLFGIMPKIGEHSTRRYAAAPSLSKHGLQADYSLSANHVFIGIFAYSLLVLKKPELLYQASGLTGPRDYPS
ncbi:hypothetical protein Landi51_06238 [Colletotrichum acutatum]